MLKNLEGGNFISEDDKYKYTFPPQLKVAADPFHVQKKFMILNSFPAEKKAPEDCFQSKRYLRKESQI